ncbi:MAG: lysine--tRNA ligase [Bacillota bacterium]
MSSPMLWPQQEARRIAERWPDRQTYILETGFGPSGHPHMGTVGEVVRTYYVAMGLKELGKQAEIIVFSDDMDGLRKIPKNIDAPWLAEHLGKPVSRIPDPYGCCPSYSAHMNRELIEMLDKTGIPYRFVASSDMYNGGHYDEVIKRIFRHGQQILDLMLPTMREENRVNWFFWQPACENCGRVNTTVVHEWDPETTRVRYSCTGEFRGVRGCGHAGEQDALGGKGKLGWKIDWAARWFYFPVHYEMYGKDLIDSAKISTEIVRILGGQPPVQMFYEMFLTEEGRKISKSVGEGITLENFHRWGTQDAVNLLMFKNPRQQKNLGPETVIRYMDEVLTLDPADPQYRFVYYHGERPDLGGLRYSDLINLMSAIGITDPDLLRPYLERTFGNARIGESWPYVRELLEKARNYYEDFILPTRRVPDLTPEQWALVDEFLALIDRETEPDRIQSGIFEIARAHGIPAREYFKLLYGVLLGADSGPRIGGFVHLLGREKVKEIVEAARQKQQEKQQI